jgi:hypothetical protein
MKPPLPAAEIRALAKEMGIPVGSRGAIPARVVQVVYQAQKITALRRRGLAAGRVALLLAPDIIRAATDRRARQKQ